MLSLICMEHKEVKQQNSLKIFWKWIWTSDSWWSYLVFLLIVFIIIKFIFLPGLGLIFGTSLPLAIVESSSMDHHSLEYCLKAEQSTKNGITIVTCTQWSNNDYEICGKNFESSSYFNIDNYWQTCGEWYENKNITREQFESFKFKNGFRKGDIMIIFGKKDINLGDVIIFNGGRNNPIIHRVISLSPLQTKGDHNGDQLAEEKSINNNQIVGVAVGRIPYLGWVKLFFAEMFNKIF